MKNKLKKQQKIVLLKLLKLNKVFFKKLLEDILYMKEIIIFARAGQGAITTAQVLGSAIVKSGLYAYAFPHFGAARMGAPMNAFLRYDDKPIRVRTRIKSADYSIVVDGTLFKSQNVENLTKQDGVIIVNSEEKISSKNGKKIVCVPANDLSLKTIGKIFANTVLLGTLCALTNIVDINMLYESMKERFKGDTLNMNLKLAEVGYKWASENKK
jgi:pyruvate ferredoxin oxidoreductase gamma subunit